MTRSETEFLHKMARRYCWEMQDGATVLPEHVVRRVMDLGVFDDALALEATFGRARLAAILQGAPAGALRPRSWWFWHYRLGLADADHDPPPMPTRGFG